METSNPTAKFSALQVALQTMKERCVHLQRRLSTLEEENQQLREHEDSENTMATAAPATVAELQRQKTQLTEHINMVSNENRKLWSRLSQIAKEQSLFTIKDKDCTLTSEDTVDDMISTHPRIGSAGSSSSGSGGANQNLIRSKTFTQHSPNPHLRQKMISDGMKDISLEEVVLDTCEEAVLGAGEAFATATEAELGFAYLNVDDEAANEPEFNLDAKKCIEGLQELRREAMKQQQELSTAVAMLESRLALQPCTECAKKSKKPEMADKSLETDESLSDSKYNNVASDSSNTNGHNYNTAPPVPFSTHLNIIQEKNQADAMDKTCPMCGKIYTSLVSFKAFQDHVEMHFIDDSGDVEASMDRNFEYISHTVGQF